MTDDKGALARTVDSHGGIHYKDEAAAARHIVRQNVNDKDALEVWTRAVLDCNELADETISVGVNFVRRTINQWVKERVEAALNRAIIGGWTAARDQYGEPSRLAGQLAALRAAVEKVRDELRVPWGQTGDVPVVDYRVKKWADRLAGKEGM